MGWGRGGGVVGRGDCFVFSFSIQPNDDTSLRFLTCTFPLKISDVENLFQVFISHLYVFFSKMSIQGLSSFFKSGYFVILPTL